MTHFTDTVAAVIEETFRRYPTVALSDGLESITFCLGTLFNDNQRTDAALANAMVDAGLAFNEDDGRKTMLAMLTKEQGLRTCADAQTMLARAGIRINNTTVDEPTRFTDCITSSLDQAEYQFSILEEMTHFHHQQFEKLLNGSYVADDARNSLAYILQLTRQLNRDLISTLFYQFVQGMVDETCVR